MKITSRSSQSAVALLLATALQRGPWTVPDLVRRARALFVPRPQGQWVTRLAQDLISVFPPNRPRPRLAVLHTFLTNSPDWLQFVKKQRKAKSRSRIRPEKVPPLMMLPVVGAPSMWRVPAIATAGHLADWLGLTYQELDWFADCEGRLAHVPEGPLRHYRYQWVAKRSGGWRLLEAPKLRLKDIQRQLLENILDEIPPHSAAHAYRRGRSLAGYLAPHAGKRVVIHFDLCDFFTSVRWPAIHALFRTAGYPEGVARLLTGLCTNITPLDVFKASDQNPDPFNTPRGMAFRLAHLPQGAPTSPALANLAAFRLDCRLSGLARKMDLQYTRYADDLVFSGDRGLVDRLTQFRILVQAIVLKEGFAIRGAKTRVMLAGSRQHVSGVTLNEHPNLPRTEYDRMRALLFNCVRFGPGSQNRDGHAHFRDHLQGKIAYWTLINPLRGLKLRALFGQIVWAE